MQKGSFLKVTMFSENDNDFITIKESFKDDVKCTI